MDNDDRIKSNELKKEYLNKYKKAHIKVLSLTEQLRELREISQSARAQSISDMPRSGKQSDLSDSLVQMEVLETKIIKQKGECLKILAEISNKIADMPDGVESTILHKKYVEFKTWEQICVDIHYSWKQTHRIHSRALNNFNYS